MKRNSIIRLIIVLLFLSSIKTVFAYPSNLDKLEKQKTIITTEWKTYNLPDDEYIALYGAKHRKFINTNWYWGEAGYGALSGKRSGYLEGGLIFGFQNNFTPKFLYDLRLFTGAGGGGSAPQGGGLIINPTLGLGYQITKAISIFTEIGYIKFLNGDIESPTFAVNFNLAWWALLYGG